MFPVDKSLTYEAFLFNFGSQAQKQAPENFSRYWKVGKKFFFCMFFLKGSWYCFRGNSNKSC
jgi:hypothetical protein